MARTKFEPLKKKRFLKVRLTDAQHEALANYAKTHNMTQAQAARRFISRSLFQIA